MMNSLLKVSDPMSVSSWLGMIRRPSALQGPEGTSADYGESMRRAWPSAISRGASACSGQSRSAHQ